MTLKSGSALLSAFLVLSLLAGCDNPPEDPGLVAEESPVATKLQKPEDNLDWIGETTPEGIKKPLDFKSVQEFRSFANHVRLENSVQAPAAVGMLLYWHEEKKTIARCTAFLVQEKVLATNSHCVPEGSKKRGSILTDRMIFISADGKQVDVDRTLIASNLDSKVYFESDYAFLLLKSSLTGVNPLKITRDGMPENEKIVVWKVDQAEAKESSFFRINRSDCEVSFHKYLFPYSVDAFSPLISLKGCHVQKGNSGSPVVAADGKVRGIVFADLINSEMIWPLVMGKEEFQALPHMGVAANFACIRDYSKPSERLSAHCDAKAKVVAVNEIYLRKNIETFGEDLETQKKEALELAKSWGLKNQDIFKFKFAIVEKKSSDRDELTYPSIEMNARCIQPYDKWKNKIRNELSKDSRSIRFKMNYHNWSLLSEVDRNFNFKKRIKVTPREATIEIRKSQLSNAEMDVLVTSVSGIPRKEKIPVCD